MPRKRGPATRSSSRRRKARQTKKYTWKIVPVFYKKLLDKSTDEVEDWLLRQDELEIQVDNLTGVSGTVTRSPSSTYPVGFPKWLQPTRAYSSDDLYASASFHGSIQGYHDYDFNSVLPANIAITKVEVGLEFTCPVDESLRIRISVDGGITWSAWSNTFGVRPEAMLWCNCTAFKAVWTREFLLDANWRVEVEFRKAGGAGCPEKEAWTAYLDWIPTRVTYFSPTLFPAELWPFYLAFARRAYQILWNFTGPTAEDELTSLINEFVLRGLVLAVLEAILVVVRHKVEVHKG